MPVVSPQKLASLQQHADDVRNICILAHVDHGKTSLTDALIATNGIISPKMAGKIRYLDSRPDEQLRGITMESSAISLYFSMLRRSAPEATAEPKEYLINLIDSPGHIDFSSEVSTASRLCDGAVVLVDAVEGVCSQTVTVLRQTWEEKLKPLLVINKMDRLVTELKITPGEAYIHLSKLLEQVNAVLGSFFQGERMEEDLNWRERMEERVKAAAAREAELASQDTDAAGEVQFEERDDEELYFAPEKNNVIFSSAIDGWAFTVRQFASLYEKKLGIKRNIMEKVLWGDFYLDPKTKKVLGRKHLKGRNLKPMFVQLVLEQVWAVYQATTGGDNRKGAEEARELARKKRAELARVQAAETNGMHDITTALESTSLDDVVPELEEKQVDPEHLIGFARIYSGTLSVGDSLQLDGSVNLAGVNLAGKPIVRVALEPVNPADLDKMIKGLKLLVQSDACAEYEQFESGEHVLLAAGELHLERCLTDLKERFARCDIQAGEPIVPYRETIVKAEEMRPPVNKDLGRGVVVGVTSSKQVSVTVRGRPLPADVTDFLLKNGGAIKRLYSERKALSETAEGGASDEPEKAEADEGILDGKGLSLDELRKRLQTSLESGKGREVWKDIVDKIVAFGPRGIGPNILVDSTKESYFSKIFAGDKVRDGDPGADEALNAAHFCDKITYAFQLATYQGPLCHEPVQGIAVFIEDITVAPADEEASARDRLGRLTGEVIKTVQQSIRQCFLDWSPRLMLAMYSCEIQASTEVLGRVYDVLTRRRGRVLSEQMKEGTPFFTIQSLLPAAESFGFADEMRKRTSGAAQPQLIFAGFDMLDEDPFWQPFTEDDLEDLGELADRENVAKRYMDRVRRRKGLLVEGRDVRIAAEKQKTLKR
ncbi:hypothetical protein DL766_004569 [Monosporascus sp. MC13-8B]|uniref:Tr-type G domain-containing protein n=1 Tax=Monosporascus cannonballus TaxID=155416 RepID=A0ABY0GWC4_9PEZI|nr:hypothetical protein DL762_008385 [Monosporascus cannonballus]RYO83220.1 hypothetical protein DL763_007953 [Monosporascus cannonballus]RYP31049.1 hypothetical protein DL766_004569 [Monosporascus sp. MC13-8B]